MYHHYSYELWRLWLAVISEIFRGQATTIMPAMKVPNFRIFFYGQLISFSGTWLQGVAETILSNKLSHGSTKWTAVTFSLMYFPTMILATPLSVLIDRFPKKKVLYWTNTLLLLQAIAVAVLTITKVITMPMMLGLSAFLGIVVAVDAPARDAMKTDLVAKEGKAMIGAANAAYAMMVTLAQILGPFLASLTIPIFSFNNDVMNGLSMTFLLNAASYVAVIVTVFMLKDIKEDISRYPVMKMITGGIKYAYLNPSIRICMFGIFISSVLSFSWRPMLPNIVNEGILHEGVNGIGILGRGASEAVQGWLYAGAGLGAFICASIISALSHRNVKSKWIVAIGTAIAGTGLMLLASAHSILVGLLGTFMIGSGFALSFVTVRGIVRKTVTPEFRGRISGIDYASFFGGIVSGSVVSGCIAEKIGYTTTLSVSGILLIMIGLWSAVSKNPFHENNN